jgi:hypothetical protein
LALIDECAQSPSDQEAAADRRSAPGRDREVAGARAAG